jgi:hypothetical protein
MFTGASYSRSKLMATKISAGARFYKRIAQNQGEAAFSRGTQYYCSQIVARRA